MFFFSCFVAKNGGGKKSVFLGCYVHPCFSRDFLDVFCCSFGVVVFFTRFSSLCFRCGFVVVGNQHFFLGGDADSQNLNKHSMFFCAFEN